LYSKNYDLIKEACELDGKIVIEKDKWINPALDYLCFNQDSDTIFTHDKCDEKDFFRLNYMKAPYPDKIVRPNFLILAIIILCCIILYFTIFIRST
jgi:hypothetical protein